MLDSLTLLDAMKGIEEHDVAVVGELYFADGKSSRMRSRRLITLALAAALIFVLGATGYAAGWFAPIFNSIQMDISIPDEEDVSPEFAEVMDEYYAGLEKQNAVYEAAEQYMNSAQPKPETVELPEFDNSKITLSERYYDGKTLLLGINLDKVIPELVINFEPDVQLMGKLNNVAFFHNVKGNDDMDVLLAEGMQREIYDDYLNNRSRYAKELDFRHLSAISLDWMLMNELSAEKYEEAWQILRDKGHICIVESSIYIGDHILMDDGTDIGQTGQNSLDFPEAKTYTGNIFIEANQLPDAAQNLDALNIQLKLRNSRTYYYMELGGPAYYCNELAGEILVPFTIENASK